MSSQSLQVPGPRQYKSRSQRPCDLCRVRKVACYIEDQLPCKLCRSKQRMCTFVQGPGPRKRPQREGSLQDASAQRPPRPTDQLPAFMPTMGLPDTNFPDMDFQFSDLEPLGGLEQEDELETMGASVGYDFTDAVQREAMQQMHGEAGEMTHPHEEPPSTYDQASHQPPLTTSNWPEDDASSRVSLEKFPGHLYRFVGFSGELDPYLLARRQYDQLLQSPSPYTSILYQQMTPLRRAGPTSLPVESGGGDALPPAVFTLGEATRIRSAEPAVPNGAIDRLRNEFKAVVDNNFARELFRLFFRFVNPHFPVLSLEQMPESPADVDKIPLQLLGAVCASSLPFIIYDDALCVHAPHAPSSDAIVRMSWDAMNLELHDIRLTTVQAVLIILQRHTDDNLFAEISFNWRRCAQLVANAQSLGLNHDPSSWTILPHWERRLRKRLWWSVVVTETWTGFGQGMSSHIDMEDCDVSLPGVEDIFDDEFAPERHNKTDSSFYHLILLTLILRDIRRSFFTLSASKRTANDLTLSLETAKPLRARLTEWYQQLPPNLQLQGSIRRPEALDMDSMETSLENDLNSTGSLRLAYIVAQLALFRALVRPIAMAALRGGAGELSLPDGTLQVIQGAVGCIKGLVRFIESLTAADWDGFWHSWSKHNFAIASTFLMHLLVLTQPSQTGSLEGCSPEQPSPPPAGSQQLAPYSTIQRHQPVPSNSPNDVLTQANLPLPTSSTAIPNHHYATEYRELQMLTRRWRWALRLAARGAGGRKGLMNVSLLRIDALFTEWQTGKTSTTMPSTGIAAAPTAVASIAGPVSGISEGLNANAQGVGG